MVNELPEEPSVSTDLQRAVMHAALHALDACYHAGLEDVPELAAAYTWLYQEIKTWE